MNEIIKPLEKFLEYTRPEFDEKEFSPPSHPGPCGPEACCDEICAANFHMSEYNRLRKQLEAYVTGPNTH